MTDTETQLAPAQQEMVALWESARKVVDPASEPSNALIKRARS